MNDSTFRLSPNATFWVLFFSLALIALLVFYEILLPLPPVSCLPICSSPSSSA